MNVLVTSAGRRVKIIEYLKKTLNPMGGIVIAADCDTRAPALYFADRFEIVPRIGDVAYIPSLLQICSKYNVKGIISLIDPELEILAKNRAVFENRGIKLILSSLEMVQTSFDKQETFRYLNKLSIPAVPTVDNYEQAVSLIESKEFKFPLIVKPKKGSASLNISIVESIGELKNAFYHSANMVVQPFYKDKEYGIDVYVDMINGHLVDMFIKEKIAMRAGETDKSISVHNRQIEKLIKELVAKTNFSGPIDIDCFEKDGEYYISEINPRFGGGYPHAFEMGCNFMEYIVTNLNEEGNPAYTGFNYESGCIMMKFDNIKILKNIE